MKDTVRRLMDRAGTSYAQDAGIKLADRPAPLYQLVVLTVLLSNRVSADLAVAAAVELRKAGFTTPEKMRAATWQQRVDALGKAHYRRYDEMTSTALGNGAELLVNEYAGDLRKLREQAGREPRQIRKLLQQVPRIAETGASIFAREAQLVWPELRPTVDKKALQGAKILGLPENQEKLAELVSGEDLARFAAALTKVALDKNLARELTG